MAHTTSCLGQKLPFSDFQLGKPARTKKRLVWIWGSRKWVQKQKRVGPFQLTQVFDFQSSEEYAVFIKAVTTWPATSQYFKKTNDRQFEIHKHMHTGDLLALNFPATSDSWSMMVTFCFSAYHDNEHSQLIDYVMSNCIFILKLDNMSSFFIDSLNNLDVYVEKPNKLR